MKEVKIHLNGAGHPIDLHVDDATHPLAAYLLLAAIPADPPASVLLSFGNSDLLGKLLMTLYERSVIEHPEFAWTLEMVSRGIIGIADAARREWPGEGTGPVLSQ